MNSRILAMRVRLTFKHTFDENFKFSNAYWLSGDRCLYYDVAIRFSDVRSAAHCGSLIVFDKPWILTAHIVAVQSRRSVPRRNVRQTDCDAIMATGHYSKYGDEKTNKHGFH